MDVSFPMCIGRFVPCRVRIGPQRHFRSREQKFPDIFASESESSIFRYGTFAPGNESSWEWKFHSKHQYASIPMAAVHINTSSVWVRFALIQVVYFSYLYST